MTLAKEARDYRDYQKYFVDQYNLDIDAHLDDIRGFLVNNASQVLGEETINQLSELERNNKPIEFMELLGTRRSQLDLVTTHYLYHRWIRLTCLNKYNKSQLMSLRKIPIVYSPLVNTQSVSS